MTAHELATICIIIAWIIFMFYENLTALIVFIILGFFMTLLYFVFYFSFKFLGYP